MKKKFLTNLLLLVILNLLIKPFWLFGIERTVQNTVGSGEYGFYFSLFNLSLIFNILLDLGITNFNNRSLSQDRSLIKKYFSNILAIRTVLAVIYVIISLSVAFLWGYNPRQISLLLVLLLNQFLALFILYLRSNISGLQFYTTDSILSVLDRTIMIVLCSLALWGNILQKPFQIEWFAYIQSVSYLTTAIIIMFIVLSKSGRLIITLDHKLAYKIIKQSLPFALLIFLMTIYNRIDGIMLERLLPDGKIQAGIYAQSYRILDAANNFALLFAGLLLPMFSNLFGSRENVFSLLKLSFSILFVFSIAFSFSCFAFNKQIIGLLYHEGNLYSSSIFSIIIVCFIPISVTYIFGTLLTAKGNLKLLNFTAVAAVFINVLLNILLIPSYKAFGAAISSLITLSFVALTQVIISFRILKINVNLNEAGKYLLFLLLSVLLVYLVSILNQWWMLRLIFSFIAVLILGLVSGILPMNQVLIFIRQQQWGSKK